MGTSASSAGPAGSNPLVPSWLGGPEPAPAIPGLGVAIPGSPLPGIPTPSAPLPGSVPPPGSGSLPVAEHPPVEAGRWRQARANFSRFAASGGGDRKAMGRAVRSYVKRAHQGSGNAARRMGASRRAAGNIVGVLGQIARDGTAGTLRLYNLDATLAGDPVAALVALTDVICGDGGTVDEAIARDAWCEVANNIEALGLASLDQLNNAQRQQIFADFIAKTIELRILNDIGAKAFRIAGSPTEIRRIHDELATYIRSATRDEVTGQFPADLRNVTPAQTQAIGDRVYDVAWAILETYEVPANAAT